MYGDGTHQESFDQEVFHYSANGGHKIFNILPSVWKVHFLSRQTYKFEVMILQRNHTYISIYELLFAMALFSY